MAIAVEASTAEIRSSSDAPARRNSTLFRRVTAQAMGMEHDSLCLKSHWVPKSSRDTCSNCKRGFRVFKAKHNCRLCGEVVCGACSSKRILFQKKSVRSCDECVNQSVESISRINRRSSVSSANGDSSSDEVGSSRERHLPKRSSESDVLVKATVVQSRQRGQSQPVTTMASAHTYRQMPHVDSWRLQLPYMIVFFLMTVAGITNFLALTA